MPEKDMSCVRVKQHKSSNIGVSERHNERKNDSYANINVVPERISYNVHFKDPGQESYMDILRRLESEGKLSLRGLRQDATLFDELVIDVNTMYFEKNGGYEYAKQFYEDAYHFLEKKFGSDFIVSAVMHADELNIAATNEVGRDTYHYHLHAVVIPVVDKEIRWSKRCKDPELRGTVKEVIRQVSHSKKWASTVPMKDENGTIVTRANGKPKYVPSYSVLQDDFVDHMRSCGYQDFVRGERGSTTENLSSLQYQIKKDTERLESISEKTLALESHLGSLQDAIDRKSLEYERADYDYVNHYEVNKITPFDYGNNRVIVDKDDFDFIRDLANEGVTSRKTIRTLEYKLSQMEDRYNRLVSRFNSLAELCKPFLLSLRAFPNLVRDFVNGILERVGVQSTDHLRNPQPLEKMIEHKNKKHEYER